MQNNSVFLSFILLSLISCSSKTINYEEISSYNAKGLLQAVIEIPAGTNDKIEYNSDKNQFQQDTINGKPKIIQFLPYPVNYGFIPSTKIHKSQKADSEPLDVLVLGKPLKTGQVVSVKPIALLNMKSNNEWDYKILSIPINKKYQNIDIKDFKDLSLNYPFLRQMIGKWFEHYDKSADVKILGWTDETSAHNEVEKWQIRTK
ncbi:inorganic diphosphatase [Psychroflexus sp. MBR-150]|jgi:inorganic pyrophosphatase